MNIRRLHWAWGCGAALLLSPAWAGSEPPAGCQVPAQEGPAWPDRQQRIAQFQGLGEHCLKTMVVACTEAAGGQMLDPGTAFSCSMGYEALLRGPFGGNFKAMLAWWQSRLATAQD